MSMLLRIKFPNLYPHHALNQKNMVSLSGPIYHVNVVTYHLRLRNLPSGVWVVMRNILFSSPGPMSLALGLSRLSLSLKYALVKAFWMMSAGETAFQREWCIPVNIQQSKSGDFGRFTIGSSFGFVLFSSNSGH